MLRVSNLDLSYNQSTDQNVMPVLENVNLQVDAGRFVSLVGPSGSGKSSILRAVMGLQEPSRGEVGLEIEREHVGILFQDDALLPWRTVRDNVALGLKIRGTPKREANERAETWLSRLSLDGLSGRYPRQLSGGQRKRVALAQVLALQPRLLLMDEPFASLDAIVRRRITQDVLDWVERERLTVLLVTHDLEEAISLSDEVCLLSQGPRATIRERYQVPLERPRDLLQTRTDPAFAPLLRKVWDDLSSEVEGEPQERVDQRQEVAA